MATKTPLQLKISSEKVQDFISWYEEAKGGVKTNPETGKERSYKGPWKRDLIDEIEYALENGTLSEGMVETIDLYKSSQDIPKGMSKEQALAAAEMFAKTALPKQEFQSFLDALEKVKAGAS